MRLPAPVPAITLVLLLGALLSQAIPDAHAQWKWRDESGRVHYSDQPPPKSVPASQVRQLGLATDPVVVGSAGASAPGGAVAAEPAKPKSWQERALELRQREAEREAEREAKAREEEQRKSEIASRTRLCDALRGEERSLESGLRIARVNREGEPIVLDDEERATRLKAVRRDLTTHCPVS